MREYLIFWYMIQLKALPTFRNTCAKTLCGPLSYVHIVELRRDLIESSQLRPRRG